MALQVSIEIAQTALLVLTSGATAAIAFSLARGNSARRKNDLTERRLAIYREVVRILTLVSQDGDISRDDLTAFRSRTYESGFLFDRASADYIDEIYSRAMKLQSLNALLKGTGLPVGEERDKITVENSTQLIWLADQLPQTRKKFERYFGIRKKGA